MARVRLPGGVCSPSQWLKLDELGARLWRRHAAADDAADVPASSRHEARPAHRHPGPARRAARHQGGLRRRHPRRDVHGQPQPVEAARARSMRSPSRRATTPPTRPAPTARSGTARSAQRHATARRSRSTGAPTCRGSSRSASRSRPATTSTSTARTSASSPSPTAASCKGFNVAIGGGLGRTDQAPKTYPRLASVIGYIDADQLFETIDAVMSVQRDYGDRVDRSHARFKYTIDDKGLDWIKAEIERRLGFALRRRSPTTSPRTATRSAGPRARTAASTARCSSRTAASSTRRTAR